MTKSELIDLMSEQNPHMYRREIEYALKIILDEISSGLRTGKRVELRGFGVFFAKERKARLGRNPKTGESVQVKSKVVPRFKISSILQDRLNEMERAEHSHPAAELRPVRQVHSS